MKFLWSIATALSGGPKPDTDEEKRFLALALCGETGEIANLIKKEWRGDPLSPSQYREKLRDELGDAYAYLKLLAIAHGENLDNILVQVTIPKAKGRWGI